MVEGYLRLSTKKESYVFSQQAKLTLFHQKEKQLRLV